MTSTDPAPLSLALDQFVDEVDLASSAERHPIVRRGEREPIPSMLRLLVWLRDRGQCTRCATGYRRLLQLDHVLPWSAGGEDVSTNLRVMCGPCNTARSNYREPGGVSALRQVTPMCDRCVENHDGRHPRWWHRRHDQLLERTPIRCPVCVPSVRIDEWDPPVIAFCGCCGSLSAVTGPGRLL